MLALVTQLSPLGNVVGSLVENVHLAVGTVGTHYILLDGFADSNLFDEIVEVGKRVLPLARRNYFDNARLHAVAINCSHLRKCASVDEGYRSRWGGAHGATYKFLEVLELVHGWLEDRNIARPVVGHHLSNAFILLGCWGLLW